MLRITLSTLRTRKGGFAGAFVALALAVVLVGACGILLESGLRAWVPAERLAGSPIVVAAKQSLTQRTGPDASDTDTVPLPERARIDRALAGRLAAVPGVRAAIPDVAFPAQVQVQRAGDGRLGEPLPGPAGHLVLGHGWDSAPLTPFALRAGRPPLAADEVVLDAGLAARGAVRVGDRVLVTATTTPARYRVVGLAAPAHGDLAHQSALFFATSEAARLAGHPGRVDTIGVLTTPGADVHAVAARVRQALTKQGISGVSVLTGHGRGQAELIADSEAKVTVIAIASSFGGIALLVALFVVAGTFGISVQQRQREIGLLRAVAATPRQVRRMISREAMVIGLAAGVVGWLPAVWLASLVRAGFIGHGVAPDTFQLYVGPLPLLVAALSPLVTGWLAVWAAGRRAARTSPTQALQEAAVQPRLLGLVRLVLGLLSLAGGVVLLRVALAAKGDTAQAVALGVVMVFMVAVGLLGPLLARAGSAILGPPLSRLAGGQGFLATVNTRANSRRLAGAITPVTLTVALACTLLFLTTTQTHAAEEQTRQRTLADHVLRADAGGPGLPAGVSAAARRLPGVAAVVGVLPTSVMATHHDLGLSFDAFQAQGVTTQGLDQVLDLDVRAGSLADLRGNAVAISSDTARSVGVAVGDQAHLWLGDGTPATLRVAATYQRGLGFGDFVLPREVVAAHSTSGLDEAVLVRTAREADPRQVQAALRGLARTWPTLQISDRSDFRAQQQAEQRQNAWLNYLLLAIIVAYTAISVINTLVMATTERTHEFALLRLVGATQRQVLGMLRWEALETVVIAISIGTAIAAATLVPFSVGLTGTPVPYVPPLLYGGVVAASAVLGFLASLLPARLALRPTPVGTISIRE
jgi:putative ABC transport system permease protein